jgi:hypothetical protein
LCQRLAGTAAGIRERLVLLQQRRRVRGIRALALALALADITNTNRRGIVNGISAKCIIIIIIAVVVAAADPLRHLP